MHQQSESHGLDVLTPAGNVTISAQKVDIVEARETTRSATEEKFKQSGVTFSVGSPIISAIQGAQNMAQAASQTSDGRMQALAAATTALNLYSNQKEISDAASALASGDVSKAASISISLGSSKSQNNSNSASDTARGDVTISALGAGQDSNLTVQGSTINAGNNAKLLADNEIKLLAAKNDYTQTSSNSSSSGSIGISLGASTGVTLSASKARGNSDGTDTSYTNTLIQAGNTASLTSGGDTTLKGAVVAANQVKADVGGNLNIQSLQDTSTFTGQQSSSGGSITIGPAFIPTGGGFSSSKSNINSNFASVAQQSGIKANAPFGFKDLASIPTP